MDWTKNPDLLELLHYNREAKERACEHANVSSLGYYGYETLCHDCGGRIAHWESKQARLAAEMAQPELARFNVAFGTKARF